MKLCVILIFGLILASCGIVNNDLLISGELANHNYSKESNDTEFKKEDKNASGNILNLKKEKYTYNNIESFYPVLVNLEDSEKQSRINTLLKNDVLKALNSYVNDNPDIDIKLDYITQLSGKDLLSIQYLGTGYTKSGVYPVNISFTTNIDLNSEKRIIITDLVKLNDNFVEILRKSKYISYDPELNVESQARDYINSFSDSELLYYLDHSDTFGEQNELGIYTYITNDSLGVSFGVPHAIGDHAEFEINFNEIKADAFVKKEWIEKLSQ
ncbi:hypothetical protein [Paenibacillus massiliensis]|uniref:hypothetical protein n=1 Tax=Paenibacillus massiliensis TaxID=225917 RepID=UPI0003F509F1|nr:hypothetical protein [Paenibacillus massiliensis]